ncbi:T9SS-dependent M36 family metallopeptidase [Pontibacter sp. E15-1]|uniref:T9SS-dependent M36 family metallopeptidase n=1 Tax=Pontibacter sp. E15-1 TaxID=2919918 RepID=UPI001F502167|nr:T9SS-dependent M36 family metallopeptidase [Pontibacter sp. E15-1]MCJ8165537.1 T9SS-dependent M36 family metallopeptidase [Pontibacter sp. E15-1]
MHKPLHSFVRLSLAAALCLGSTLSFAQGKGNPEKKQVPAAALEHIKKNKQKLDLTDEDIADIELSSESVSKKTGVKHVYMKQLYQGIEIHGAITNISLDKTDHVLTMGNGLHKGVSKKVKGKEAGLDAEAAVAAATRYLNISIKEALTVKERGKGRDKEVLFSTGGISLEPIPARLVYQPMEDGSLVLAWEVSIYELDAQNWWNLRLDANTGKVLDKDNMVTQCQFDNDGPGGQALHNSHSHTAVSPYIANMQPAAAASDVSNAYSVFALPLESPKHGPRTLVSTSAADQNASPNGWHYTPFGNETRTRGNNVFAYEDPNNNNNFTTNYSPDGGAALNFDFPVDFTQQPATYTDAATANLFYVSNVIHDVWYQYGFDETSGNFQYDNFGKGGLQSDPVMAESQDSRNIAATRNNANFSTPRDGFYPRMQMYLWSGIPDADMFKITTPSNVAGSYPALEGTFSKPLTPTPLTGKLVVVEAATGNANEGCSEIINTAALGGNIAVIYRGSCGFADKVQNAQKAGAIAVVVINNVAGGPSIMGGTPTQAEPAIAIPAVMISQADGKTVQDLLTASVEVRIALKNDGSGPEFDGDFDNGIIAHEYGHGISNRLTGGALVTNCLANAEQMGEGWSDWIGLMMTMRQGDSSVKPRGIGTYASGQAVTGKGIRPAPYSTDFGVNNYTYGTTNNPALAAPHGVGFVWATMLWDMTWAMVDKYGYDADLYYGKGGNNMAMQLVMDGLKMQPCRPGFVDGRDAILAADKLNNGGANQELIWRVFAKRGLGFSASQGSSGSRLDQVEAFDLPPVYACDAPVIAVTPSSNEFTGGDAKTVYIGYGPQSVTLTASGDPTFTYTWAPVAGLSNTDKASAVFAPKSAGTYTLSVTAVNGDQCTRSATVTIKVVDVRCGSKNTKVMVCVDGENNCVDPKAVAKLLKNAGGKLGDCSMSVSTVATAVAAEGASSLDENLVSSYPNPFSESTNIRFTAKESGHALLKVYDVTGREVATLFDGTAEKGVTYTKTFKAANKQAGLYIYRLVNGGTMKSGTMLLVK